MNLKLKDSSDYENIDEYVESFMEKGLDIRKSGNEYTARVTMRNRNDTEFGAVSVTYAEGDKQNAMNELRNKVKNLIVSVRIMTDFMKDDFNLNKKLNHKDWDFEQWHFVATKSSKSPYVLNDRYKYGKIKNIPRYYEVMPSRKWDKHFDKINDKMDPSDVIEGIKVCRKTTLRAMQICFENYAWPGTVADLQRISDDLVVQLNHFEDKAKNEEEQEI